MALKCGKFWCKFEVALCWNAASKHPLYFCAYWWCVLQCGNPSIHFYHRRLRKTSRTL